MAKALTKLKKESSCITEGESIYVNVGPMGQINLPKVKILPLPN